MIGELLEEFKHVVENDIEGTFSSSPGAEITGPSPEPA